MIRTDALMEASLLQHEMQADVRFGSLTDMTALSRDVRFTPNSGHSAVAS